MRDLHIKYKILWFCVDTHHRQRYFFICGCKQTVTKPRREPEQFQEKMAFGALSKVAAS